MSIAKNDFTIARLFMYIIVHINSGEIVYKLCTVIIILYYILKIMIYISCTI